MIGILPTLSAGHMSPTSLTPNPRYQLLSDQILAARGEDIVIDIGGPERLRTTADSIVPEAACTSTQLHIQVSPEDFPAYWNASQAIAGVQLALGAELAVPARPGAVARDPGRRCSSRPPTPAARSSRPRGCARGCGSASAGSPRSSTCSRRTSATSRRCCRCSRTRTRSRCWSPGGRPALAELRLHNGTIYRWNRPVYDVVDGTPAPAGGEPRAARRADRRGHDGQRRVLLRPGPRAGRARAAAVVADVVQRGRGELPRRRPAGHRGQRLLAGSRAGAGHRARGATAAADGPGRPGRLGRPAPRRATGCSASSSSAASSVRTAPPGSPTGSTPGSPTTTTATGSTRCAARSTSTASGCTPTSRCTPGSEPVLARRLRGAAASRPASRR